MNDCIITVPHIQLTSLHETTRENSPPSSFFVVLLPSGPLEEAAALGKHHCFRLLVGRPTSWLRQLGKLGLPLPSDTGGLRRLKLCSNETLALLEPNSVACLLGDEIIAADV